MSFPWHWTGKNPTEILHGDLIQSTFYLIRIRLSVAVSEAALHASTRRRCGHKYHDRHWLCTLLALYPLKRSWWSRAVFQAETRLSSGLRNEEQVLPLDTSTLYLSATPELLNDWRKCLRRVQGGLEGKLKLPIRTGWPCLPHQFPQDTAG